ncbi:MAG: hypothetical protein R2824_36120 [Saprospiraceae bacterium]|nr:hypothetical protein [Lewinella sp.]
MWKLFWCLFLILPFTLYSQDILVSEDMPLRNDVSYELIGELRGNILLYHNRNTEHEIQCFDPKMHLDWSKELEFERKTAKTLGLITHDDHFYILYHYRKKGNTLLKVHKYDAGANLKDSTLVFDYGFLFFTPDFEIVRSEDRSKVLIFFIEKQSIMRAVSFDLNTMKLLWEKSITPDKFNYSEDDVQLLVDNKGNMQIIIGKHNFRSRRRDHFYEVHSYYGDTDEHRIFQVPFGNMLTYDAYFTYDDLNDRMVAAGFYAEKDLGRATGLFYLNVDPRHPDQRTLNFQKFDTKTLTGMLGKKGKRAKGLREISVQEVVLRRDGGAILIGERNRMYERGGTTRTYIDGLNNFMVDYYFDELMIASIHPTGELHWNTILHKKQYSQDDNAAYSSYFLFKTPSSLRFLFNDEISYENTVSEYILNGLGDFDRNSLLNTAHLELRLRFRDAVQTASNTLIVPSERRNRLKLVKMEF